MTEEQRSWGTAKALVLGVSLPFIILLMSYGLGALLTFIPVASH